VDKLAYQHCLRPKVFVSGVTRVGSTLTGARRVASHALPVSKNSVFYPNGAQCGGPVGIEKKLKFVSNSVFPFITYPLLLIDFVEV
jgi:hypothetical protein